MSEERCFSPEEYRLVRRKKDRALGVMKAIKAICETCETQEEARNHLLRVFHPDIAETAEQSEWFIRLPKKCEAGML